MRSLPRHLLVSLALLLGSMQLASATLAPEIVECAGDCPDGDESPGCLSSCSCSSHAPRLQPPVAAVTSLPVPESTRGADSGDEVPPPPDPEPLRHVPKSVRA